MTAEAPTGSIREIGLGRFVRRIGLVPLANAGLPTAEDATGRKNLLLLIQLRWIAVGGQILTMLAVAAGFGATLPTGAMAAVLAALVTLNLGSLLRLRTRVAVTNAELFAALLFDVAALTTQLALTGGATNPFAFLYLLQVTLGAVLLEAWPIWAMVALTGLCFAGLTVAYRPLDLPGFTDAALLELRIGGLLVCFALDAALLAVFVTRINRNLRERDARLADLRQQAAEEDHIVRMGLLASGAAHELGTPLATLSVILGDWRRMPTLTSDAELCAEIDAMEAQVRRCKAIVTGTLLSAGEARGDSTTVTTLHDFLDDLVEEWGDVHPSANLSYDVGVAEDLAIASDSALKQVVFNVLDNAVEASPYWIGFEAATREGEMLVLAVTDLGPGFAPGMAERIGKPYRSSKGQQGRGLGLFFVVNVLRKLGGRVEAANRPEGGAIVTMELPLAALAITVRRPHGG